MRKQLKCLRKIVQLITQVFLGSWNTECKGGITNNLSGANYDKAN